MNDRPAGFTAKASTDARFKMSDDGAGTVEGYFAVFGNKDSAGEVIEPGAFTKHLPEFLKKGFLADHHDWKKRVGYPVEAKEDERGLFVKFAFHSDPAAQAVRTRLKEREEAGLENGLSIGYAVPKGGAEQTKEAKRLKEIRLFEGSPVAVPCNQEARAASVKSDAGDAPDPETPETKAPPAGQTFSDEHSTVLAAGEDFAARAETFLARANDLLIEKRVKEGRAISTLNRSRIESMRAVLTDALGVCDELIAAAARPDASPAPEVETAPEPSVASLRAASLRLQSKAVVLASGAPS